jgi:GNAT superfamily N-acetyltransferase
VIVTFRTRMPIRETMCFEDAYEESLQLDEEEKRRIIDDGVAVWMFVDSVLAGECYGLTPAKLNEDVPDVPRNEPLSIYCYSSTVLPQFQGRGLSKLLVAYWNGLVRGKGFTKVVGHATDSRIATVRSSFGVRFGAVRPNWFGTARTAHYYEGDL